MDSVLSDALCELREVEDEAREEHYTLPSEVAMANAERLVHAIHEVRAALYLSVFPTDEPAVMIDIRRLDEEGMAVQRQSVLVECRNDGRAATYVHLDGNHRRAVYDAEFVDRLPDAFLREALEEL